MYVPLRTHGHHSLLTGVDAPATLLERARDLGLPALALADVNSLAGLVEFLQAAEAKGPRPIVAAELSEVNGSPGRLVALVENEAGYRNLCRLLSARHLGDDPGACGADLPPPEDFDLVQEAARYQDGLIFLADHPRLLIDLHGRVPAENLLVAVSPASLARAVRDRRRPGRTRNAHLDPVERAAPSGSPSTEGIPVERVVPARAVSARDLVEAARATGVATVAVPDVYHAWSAGQAEHRLRVAIGTRALVEQVPDAWLAEKPSHLLSPAEMCALYADLEDVPGPWAGPTGALSSRPEDRSTPGAVARTLAVAERCRYTPPLGGVLFPEIELEPGDTAYSRLCSLAFEGARERYRPLRPEILRRLDFELSTIHDLGFAPYFLLVKGIADFARAEGIPCVGRGSAADSLVAYCLRLTDADPLRYRLPFERFLNPERRDRPDIDLDFCWRRRDEVLEHVYELFGAQRTAMICTLNRFGLRSAFRESALALGIPPAQVNRWASRLPHFPPGATPLPDGVSLPHDLKENPVATALASAPEAREFPFREQRWQRVLRAAAGLLDAPRHFGLHPGGVVVSPGPITNHLPCQRAAKGMVVTQFDKDAVEAVGLVKIDLLGNRALTVLADCLDTLARRGIEIDPETIPEDDPRTARLLMEGRTIGCFQIESPGMRNLLKQIGAKTMDDVIQAVALIRPGPAGSGMKDAYVRRCRGLEPATPPHPRLTDVLWDTHGVMLYQEDVMQAAAHLAGMDLAQADLLRRALQKRSTQDLEQLRDQFRRGCTEQGLTWEEVRGTWELIANFAAFAFCKAHAVTYGRIAYRTAWLKAHHPAAFLTAFLASETGYYPRRVYVEEARRLGVPILGPSVNHSERTFSVEWMVQAPSAPAQPALRTGLSQVKGLSHTTLERLFTSRATDGAFLSLPDLLDRTGAHVDEAEHLIQSGALDDFDRTRPELLWRLHLLRSPRQRLPRGEAVREGGPLDMALLDACRATPASRREEAVRSASANTGAWGQAGLGFGGHELSVGEVRSLFPAPPLSAVVLPGLPDTDRHTRGRLEFECLGFTITDHPLRIFPCPADERAAANGRRLPRATPCAKLEQFRGGRITLRGWPAATRRLQTEEGSWMRFLTLEDESGVAEVVLFPDVYRRDGHLLSERGSLCITGVVDEQMGAHTLRAERIW